MQTKAAHNNFDQLRQNEVITRKLRVYIITVIRVGELVTKMGLIWKAKISSLFIMVVPVKFLLPIYRVQMFSS